MGVPIVKTVRLRGDELALVFDRELLEQLKIAAQAPSEIDINGQKVLVEPAAFDSDFSEAAEYTGKKYDELFRRLSR